MIGSGITSNVGEEMVAQRELLGVGPVRSDVGLVVLLAHRFGSAREPSRVIVGKSPCRWVGSVRESRVSLGTGKSPKVAVKGMVFLEDDNDMLKRAFGDDDTPAGRSRKFNRLALIRTMMSLLPRTGTFFRCHAPPSS